MIKKFLLMVFVMVSVIVSAQDNSQVLSWSQPWAYFSNLMFLVHQRYAQRNLEFSKALGSKDKMQKYSNDVRQRYLDLIGPMPEPCELNARVTGKIKQKGFSVEKIVFQSTRGRYVTANLYVPDGKGKHPAVIMMCGHGLTGKEPGQVEPLLARNGIAVMVVDPIGEGERWQLMDSQGNYATRGVTTEHTLVNAGCVVMGTSLAALMVWDNSCAVTYLKSRKDIDDENIGACGSSGGGTETAYLIGFDDRIKAATICSYFSNRERTLELLGPSDGCQHISGEGAAGIELEDFALMMAPKPVLVMNGKYDFVDLWGAVNGFHNLQKAYSILGDPNNVDQILVETGHGMGKEKRNKMVRFFKYWLCHEDSTKIIDDESKTFTLEDSYCSPKHQVNLSYADAESIPQSNLRLSAELSAERGKFMKQSRAEQTKIVLSILGIEKNNAIRSQLNKKQVQRDFTEYRYEIFSNGQMPIPVIIYVPDKFRSSNKVKIILDDRGKGHFLSKYENYNQYISDGTIIVAADLCGRGETEDLAYFNDAKYWNQEYRIAMTSLHMNKPIMGQRVKQVLTLIQFIKENEQLCKCDIDIEAIGIYGPTAVHAAFLCDDIKDVEISGAIKSFNEFNSNPLQKDMFSNVLVGVLRHYDLFDLIKLSKGKVHYSD